MRPSSEVAWRWSSSNEAVASVDRFGNVTGNAKGTAIITATPDGVSASRTYTVVPNPVARLTIELAETSVRTGDVLHLVAGRRLPQHFQRALAAGGQRPEEQLSLWFEIGNACELLGKASEALVWYEKVEEANPTFRDVAQRIERLGVRKTEAQETDEFDTMFDNMIVKE